MTSVIAASFMLASDSVIRVIPFFSNPVAVWREWERCHKEAESRTPGAG